MTVSLIASVLARPITSGVSRVKPPILYVRADGYVFVCEHPDGVDGISV